MIEEPTVIEKILTHPGLAALSRRHVRRRGGGWVYWGGLDESAGFYRAERVARSWAAIREQAAGFARECGPSVGRFTRANDTVRGH